MKLSKDEIRAYTGDYSQLFGIRKSTLQEGKGQGVTVYDFHTSTGLEFSVLPDRGLDIAWFRYKGINLSYISSAGIVAPQYYDSSGNNFLRSFYGGFLTTCGLRNIGPPCKAEGEEFGLHGRIANEPAENISSSVIWKEDTPFLTVSGTLREARLFGENLRLHRMIFCKGTESRVTIQDNIENLGFKDEVLMVLYHFNLGYPMLDENTEILAPIVNSVPRDEISKNGLTRFNLCQKPTGGFIEEVFHHKLAADQQGQTMIAVVNCPRSLAVKYCFNTKELFNLTQWKMMGEGNYVLGLEPSNALGSGREDLVGKHQVEFLEAGKTKHITMEIEILEGEQAISSLKKQINSLVNNHKER